jgi:hypothetical protein
MQPEAELKARSQKNQRRIDERRISSTVVKQTGLYDNIGHVLTTPM